MIPFPSQLCLPACGHRKRMGGCVATTFKSHGSAPWWSQPWLGPFFGVKGAPRCPWAAADAAGSVCWARGGGWGPRVARVEQTQVWGRVMAWAERSTGRGHSSNRDARAGGAARRLVQVARDRLVGGTGTRLRRGLGAAAYVGIWLADREDSMVAWLLRLSATRRWLPTDGRE